MATNASVYAKVFICALTRSSCAARRSHDLRTENENPERCRALRCSFSGGFVSPRSIVELIRYKSARSHGRIERSVRLRKRTNSGITYADSSSLSAASASACFAAAWAAATRASAAAQVSPSRTTATAKLAVTSGIKRTARLYMPNSRNP